MDPRTRIAVVTLVVFLAPRTVQAAQIYGALSKDGSPLGGTPVTVVCDSGDRDETRTDDRGAYRLFVAHTGRCTLSLPEHGGASAAIFSFDEPVRFDFDVVPAGGGFQLRKR
jgi:hypothetical protein